MKNQFKLSNLNLSVFLSGFVTPSSASSLLTMNEFGTSDGLDPLTKKYLSTSFSTFSQCPYEAASGSW